LYLITYEFECKYRNAFFKAYEMRRMTTVP
jgi:hypothetical protein